MVEEDQVYMTLSKPAALERETWRVHFVKLNCPRQLRLTPSGGNTYVDISGREALTVGERLRLRLLLGEGEEGKPSEHRSVTFVPT